MKLKDIYPLSEELGHLLVGMIAGLVRVHGITIVANMSFIFYRFNMNKRKNYVILSVELCWL